MLPARCGWEAPSNLLKSFGVRKAVARLSLQILKISLQILNCRENRARDRFASDCILSHAVVKLHESQDRERSPTLLAPPARRDQPSSRLVTRQPLGPPHERGGNRYV